MLALLMLLLGQPATVSWTVQVQPLAVVWSPHPTEARDGIDNYQIRLDDDKTWAPSGVPVPQPEYTRWLNPARLATLKPGVHTVYLRACAGTKCQADVDARSVAFDLLFVPIVGFKAIQIPE